MANKPQITVWHQAGAASSAPLIEQSEGDGLNGMRALRSKYNERLCYLYALEKNVDYYVHAVVALDAFIEGEQNAAA